MSATSGPFSARFVAVSLGHVAAVGQTFFIGDGLSDGNIVQQFIAPSGATRVFLSIAASIGASGGNLGSLSGDVTGATAIAAAVPEPAHGALLAAGFVSVGGMARRRRMPSVVA